MRLNPGLHGGKRLSLCPFLTNYIMCFRLTHYCTDSSQSLHYYPYFTDEEAKAKGGKVNCSVTKLAADLQPKSRSVFSWVSASDRVMQAEKEGARSGQALQA